MTLLHLGIGVFAFVLLIALTHWVAQLDTAAS